MHSYNGYICHSVSILSRKKFLICLIQKRPLYYRTSYRIDASYLKYFGVKAKCNDSKLFCFQVQSYLQSDPFTIKLGWWQQNIILFFCQTLVRIFYLILLKDEHAQLITYPLFLTERVLFQRSQYQGMLKILLFASVICLFLREYYSNLSTA